MFNKLRSRITFEFNSYWKNAGGIEFFRFGFFVEKLEFKKQIVSRELIIALTILNLSFGVGIKL